jgi:hypothetical protein
MLVRGEREGIGGEGVHTLAMMRDHALIHEDDYPLFRLVHRIVDDPVNIRERIWDYLSRQGEQAAATAGRPGGGPA